MASVDNPIITISKDAGVYCCHSIDYNGNATMLSWGDDRPDDARCITEVKFDREYTTCSCGLFVWKRVEGAELFNTAPVAGAETGNHLPLTIKQERYINVLVNKIQRRHDIMFDTTQQLELDYKLNSMRTRGDASKVIDYLKGILGE